MMAALDDIPVRGELREDEPMSRHTSWRAGGPAELFFVPADIDDLQAFLGNRSTPTCRFSGTASAATCSCATAAFRGVVISATRILKDLERTDPLHRARGAGLPCTQLARQCVRWGIGPAEFFAGIPGTIGGALAMNAGAHGGETWERVESVRTIDRRGTIRLSARRPSTRRLSQRDGPGRTNGSRGDASVSTPRRHLDARSDERHARAPQDARSRSGLPSCGSVFRNPPGDHAARLIEAAGLKGYSIGGAECQRQARELHHQSHRTRRRRRHRELIEHVRQTVRSDEHGVELLHEVRIVGEARFGIYEGISTVTATPPKTMRVIVSDASASVASLSPRRPFEPNAKSRCRPETPCSRRCRQRGVDGAGLGSGGASARRARGGGFRSRLDCAAWDRAAKTASCRARSSGSVMPYTGSGVMASALAMDKVRSKHLFAAAGIPTPDYAVVKRNRRREACRRSLRLSADRQAALQGSSVGMSKVFDGRDLLDAAVDLALASSAPRR